MDRGRRGTSLTLSPVRIAALREPGLRLPMTEHVQVIPENQTPQKGETESHI